MAESDADDVARALQLYGASLEGDPTDGIATLSHMRALAEAYEDWGSFVEIARAEAERRGSGGRAELAWRIGQAFEIHLGDAEQAVAFYQAAFGEDSAASRPCVPAASSTGPTAMGPPWPSCSTWSCRPSARTMDRRAVLTELAWLLGRDLNQPELARQAFDELVRRWPGDADNEAALAQLGGPLDAAVQAEAGTVAEVIEDADLLIDGSVVEPIEAAPRSPPAEARRRGPVAEEPVAEGRSPRPVAEEPVAEEPVAEEPVAEEPAAEARRRGACRRSPSPKAVAEEPAGAAVDGDVAAQVAELEALASEASGAERVRLLIQAVAALNSVGGAPNSAGLYLAAVRTSPEDVAVYWKVGRDLKVPASALTMIAGQLDALAEVNHHGAGAPLAAHRILFGARHLDEDKGVDFSCATSRARAATRSRVLDWQVQYLIETDKVAQRPAGHRPAGGR
ncbi:MAG: hypothetical protein R3F43_08680 [bacterium]